MAGKRGLEEDDCLSAADVSVKKGKHVLSEGMLTADEEDGVSQVSCVQCVTVLHFRILPQQLLSLPDHSVCLLAGW